MPTLMDNDFVRFAQRIGICLVLFACCARGTAQQGVGGSVVDKATVQLLLAKIDQLETRVTQLEAGAKTCSASAAPDSSVADLHPSTTFAKPAVRQAAGGAQPELSQSGSTDSSEAEQGQADSAMNERMDLSRTLMRIRGFGDISLHGDTQKGDTTSFSLGQLELFITSDLSDRYRFLSEVVFEAGPDDIYGVPTGQENSFGVDIERYLLQFNQSQYFNLSIGRGHTAIGYYNTAYHHSTWMQTTVDRPLLFEFEDRGGILPIHMVGASATGLVPSGPLGLHYIAEFGNGRESAFSLTTEPVQNEVSDGNHKAFNLGLFARPESVHGFQAGFSYYRDLLLPAHASPVLESIPAVHVILIRPKFEWLNEALLDRHTQVNLSRTFNTPGFYSQISKQFGSYRPYFRYEYVNASNNEPIFPAIGLRHGPLFGVRYDANESVAVKFQYNYTFLRNQPGVNGLTTQVGFTF